MTIKTALIVDDEPDIRELLEITLMRMGIDTCSAENITKAKALLETQEFNLCLTDMNLPDGNGIDLVCHIQQYFPQIPVAVITAYGSVETAITSLKSGAFDFVSKPVDLARLRELVSSALKLTEEKKVSKEAVETGNLLLGESPEMERLRKQIRKLARSQAPVYISGESGSGKELVARMMHLQGPRSEAPFVPVNCGAIPSELMESEFFGHKKGSFSGAVENKEGLFQAANGGTLFLDEVADLPIGMQVKLLRAIQEKAVRPVGEQKEVSVDVRILSATHKNLAELVETGEFRQDLYYRINVIELDVPKLRERKSDIPLLANHILQRIAEECDIFDAKISDDAMSSLKEYHFPGNVRELENIIERAFTLCENDVIETSDLQLRPASKPDGAMEFSENSVQRSEDTSLEDFLEGIERKTIEQALEETRWNKTAAAKKLGITFRALRYRLKKLDME
ncbi:sigma-54-dependent transcriptional regulator [Alkalimarinus alittae]|uniref:Sigma-54 dependent transcriptional regulator n=1 Tax=Alkalimarinus alittae TaxID=2961619 RepID=A0ABY6N0Q4_9ALTE|nr:sigma-54 dependent transcriptional regulator [Alkalimarinus alittae]UZE95597.1 sigma-54 dependent transcriptional regulator [Alkalimarinus alittae]